MEKNKSCDGHYGPSIRHGEEWCCEGRCFICEDGSWVEKRKR
jgi:acetyltransferase-like isoleucine patch superfamily enzyme